jgi:signal transduction histidine kinase/DNA-binding response OmpR family regulator
MLVLVSCGKNTTESASIDVQEREQLEKKLDGINSKDSLYQVLEDFRQAGNTTGQIAVYRHLAQKYRQGSEFQKAISHAQEGLKLAKDADDTLETIMLMNELGYNYRCLGILDEAIEYHLHAYFLNKKQSGEDSVTALKNEVMAQSGMGNAFLVMSNYELADSLFRQALAGETSLNRKEYIANSLSNLGFVKEKKGEHDSAWIYYRQSLEMNESCGSKLGIALCHNHFGQLYEKNNQLDEALEEYRAAYHLLDSIDEEWHRLETGLDIIHIYIKKGELRDAEPLLTKARETAYRMGALEQRITAYYLAYELYLKKGNIQQALNNYKAGNELQDSLLNMEKWLEIQNARLTVERETHREEIAESGEQLAHERQSKQMSRMVLGVLLAVAIVCIFVLYYTLRQKVAHQRMIKTITQAKEQFFTNITHEFRTPLTVILGLGHQLEDHDAGDVEQVRSAAKMIVRQGDSLLSLINQLLDISKVRSAAGVPQWRRGNIVGFVEMALENYYPYAASKHIELSYTHSLTEIEMDFSPEYMRKIVSNLVANAIKFSSNYAKVNVTLEKTSNNYLKLQVFDTGRGISPTAMPHIFEAFYQGMTDSNEVGSGIGLSLVKLMVEAMDGTVSAESIEGQGSTFTVLLPLKHKGNIQLLEEKGDSGAADAAGTETRSDEDLVTDARKSQALADAPLVLIVEDNKDIAYYIASHLSQYHLHFAQNTEEAMQSALTSMPDLIITDVMMPGSKDGLDLCREVRSSEVLNHVPIIIITAKTTEVERIKGLEAGADAYLVKPFNSEELLVRVEKLLERQRVLRQKYESLLDGEQQVHSMSTEDQKFMNRIIDNIYSLMNQGRVDVETLAGKMALSRSQLNRRVLSITGQNTSMLMMRVRLSYAKRLLKADTLKPIGEVAVKCGFDDLAYFSRIFKQAFGLTPSQYRKQI